MLKARLDVPEKLDDNFFGYTLNDEQKLFKDSVWNPDVKIIFSDSKAGTGKSLIAVGTAVILVEYCMYEGITYIVSPTQELKQGYLPGTLEEKTQFYFQPLYQSLSKIGKNPMIAIAQCNIMNKKNGNDFIDAIPHTFLRGTTFENRVVIIDEAQNFTIEELRKVLTRISDNCKTIVIGHSGQIDLLDKNNSGFTKYLNWFKNEEYCKICNLNKNYRGKISMRADDLPC